MLVLGPGTVERNQKVNLSSGNRAEGRPWGDRGEGILEPGWQGGGTGGKQVHWGLSPLPGLWKKNLQTSLSRVCLTLCLVSLF